jgi:hypothetical protein
MARDGRPGDAELACVDWHAAITALQVGQLPCSAGDSAMLRITASQKIPVELREALTRFDSHNARLVARARRTRNRTTGHQR